MKLADVLEHLTPVVGLTSLIDAPGSVDSRGAGTRMPTLAWAREQLDRLMAAQDACTSDSAWWGYAGQIGYWRALVWLLMAAEITGPDDLPDVALPERGGMVMDSIGRLEDFGRRVLELARATERTTPAEG